MPLHAGMSFKEAKDFFESLSQEARNRLRGMGFANFTLHIQVCPEQSNALHLVVKDRGEVAGNLHIWTKGDMYPPSDYENFFQSLCIGLANAESFRALLQKAPHMVARFKGDTHKEYIH